MYLRMGVLVAVLLSACASAVGAPVGNGTVQPISAGATFEVAFSPSAGALETVLRGIERARHSILVAAYSFTSKPIATALLDAQVRGVKVAVVADERDNSKQYSVVTFLANNRVPVRLNGKYAIHHHKFMVIDGESVQTGSFNYSAAAVDKNAENVLLLSHIPELAQSYAAEWRRLWDESSPLLPKY